MAQFDYRILAGEEVSDIDVASSTHTIGTHSAVLVVDDTLLAAEGDGKRILVDLIERLKIKVEQSDFPPV